MKLLFIGAAVLAAGVLMLGAMRPMMYGLMRNWDQEQITPGQP